MKNRLFDDDSLSIIARPERWRVVSSAFLPEISDVDDVGYKRWMAHHSHVHDTVEFVFAFGGYGVIGFGGRVYPVAPGSLLVFGPNEVHDGMYPAGSPDLRHLWVYVLRDHFFARMAEVRNGELHESVWNVVCTREETGLDGAWPFGRLECEGLPDSMVRLMLQSAVGILLATVVRKGYQEELDGAVSIQAEVVRAIKKHVRNTAGTGAGLDALAQMTGYSKYHLFRVFRRHVGMTIHEYADACRLEKVEDMLAMGCSQARIAEALGFASPSSFARWWKGQRAE